MGSFWGFGTHLYRRVSENSLIQRWAGTRGATIIGGIGSVVMIIVLIVLGLAQLLLQSLWRSPLRTLISFPVRIWRWGGTDVPIGISRVYDWAGQIPIRTALTAPFRAANSIWRFIRDMILGPVYNWRLSFLLRWSSWALNWTIFLLVRIIAGLVVRVVRWLYQTRVGNPLRNLKSKIQQHYEYNKDSIQDLLSSPLGILPMLALMGFKSALTIKDYGMKQDRPARIYRGVFAHFTFPIALLLGALLVVYYFVRQVVRFVFRTWRLWTPVLGGYLVLGGPISVVFLTSEMSLLGAAGTLAGGILVLALIARAPNMKNTLAYFAVLFWQATFIFMFSGIPPPTLVKLSVASFLLLAGFLYAWWPSLKNISFDKPSRLKRVVSLNVRKKIFGSRLNSEISLMVLLLGLYGILGFFVPSYRDMNRSFLNWEGWTIYEKGLTHQLFTFGDIHFSYGGIALIFSGILEALLLFIVVKKLVSKVGEVFQGEQGEEARFQIRRSIRFIEVWGTRLGLLAVAYKAAEAGVTHLDLSWSWTFIVALLAGLALVAVRYPLKGFKRKSDMTKAEREQEEAAKRKRSP